MTKAKGALAVLDESLSATTGNLRSIILRSRLRTGAFSIVSNNCWGAHIYKALRIPYQTPFVGLFIMPECYLALLEDFSMLLSCKLEFKTCSKDPCMDQVRAEHGCYPIGELGGVCEIHFLHYASEAEAKYKWESRCQRIAPSRDAIFIKICGHDGCTSDQLRRFDHLAFGHKVAFTSRQTAELACEIIIPGSGGPFPDGLELSRISPRYFDAIDWLNGGDGRSAWPRFLRFL